ncbi:MAG: bifunctional nuclease family protein [Balneolales bacterium]
MDNIHMDILGLSTSPSSGGAYALILNETEGNRRLPIIIGTFEAQAIALELEHIKPPRPMTHDLLRNVIQSFNTFVKQITIHELKEGTFYAKVLYDHDGQNIEQDARPSDAIALAIRFNAPIYVSKLILDEAGIISEPKPDDIDEPSVMKEEQRSARPESAGDAQLRRLEKSLTKAIAEEDYESAARIRDEIRKMKE